MTETQTETHTLRGFDVSLSGTGGAAQRWTCDALKALGPNCPSILASGGTSVGVWWRDTGDGRLVSLENGGRPTSGGQPACGACVVTARVTTPGTAGTTRKVVLAQPGTLQVNRVYEVSGRYVRFLGTTAAGRRFLVADVETGKILRDTAVVGQALQGGRLWTASATGGTVSAVDLRTGATVETHDLGTKCEISTLEAVGRWLLARCGGSQSVTMYDREKKASTTFTVGHTAEARLGDGFVVSTAYSDMGYSLGVTDFRSGARVDRWYDPSPPRTSTIPPSPGRSTASAAASRTSTPGGASTSSASAVPRAGWPPSTPTSPPRTSSRRRGSPVGGPPSPPPPGR
ncbi:hypothetical protein ACQ86F_16800 [Streptomyces venezuelae ATCC 10712]